MEKQHRKRVLSFVLASAMVFTTAFGSGGIRSFAAEEDEFVEVEVPNGDFESGETVWTFTGEISNLDYQRRYDE